MKNTGWHKLRAWLLLEDSPAFYASPAAWRLSALRILLLSALALESVVAWHSAWMAARDGRYQVGALVLGFYVVLLLAAWGSARRPRLGGALLLLAVYVAGVCISAFIHQAEVARLGLMLLYAAPLVARLLFNTRLALGLMLFNVLPFWLQLRYSSWPPLLPFDLTLPASSTYIQGLIFLFFNACVPLAAFRVLDALDGGLQRQRHLGQALEEAGVLYRETFEQTGPTLWCDADGQLLRVNAPAAQLLGQPVGVLENRANWFALAQPEKPPHADLVAASEWSIRRPDGSVAYVEISKAYRSARQHWMLVLTDRSQMRQMQASLQESEVRTTFLSLHDALTRLPNREMLLHQLDAAMLRLADNHCQPVVCLRLNSIRQVNERQGVQQGDALIQVMASHLQRVVSERGAFVSRLRGVVFCLVLPPATHADAALDWLDKLRAALPSQVVVGAETVQLNLSWGAAFYPTDGETAIELVRHAEIALDEAKRRGDGRVVAFDLSTARALRRRVELELGLQRALAEQGLDLVYQPKVARDGAILGFEALVRWHDPVMGSISPAEFIPLAEETGQISRVTDYVIEGVARQIQAWRQAGVTPVPVAINLSSVDVIRPDLLPFIQRTCSRYGVQPDALEFEITETSIMQKPEQARYQLGCLKAQGFRIAMDDFGTGYSSLAKLHELPISTVKIDRSFVLGVPGNPRLEKVINTILSLTRALDFKVVAEGVEDAEQIAYLDQLGCNLYQGYFYFRPQPAEFWHPHLEAA